MVSSVQLLISPWVQAEQEGLLLWICIPHVGGDDAEAVLLQGIQDVGHVPLKSERENKNCHRSGGTKCLRLSLDDSIARE